MERTEGICRRRSNPIRVTCNQPGNVHLHLCGRLPPKRKKRSHTHQEETSCLNETFHTSTMCLEGKRSRRCNSQGRDFRSRTTLQVICWVIHFTFCWQSGTPPPPSSLCLTWSDEWSGSKAITSLAVSNCGCAVCGRVSGRPVGLLHFLSPLVLTP